MKAKYNIWNKVMCFFLIIVMSLSLIPFTAFADTGNNSGGQTGDTTDTNASDLNWSYVPQYWGLRFSLYWTPGNDFDKNIASVIRVGNTVDVTKTGFSNYAPTKASMLSVFDRMRNEDLKMSISDLKKNGTNFTYKAYTSNDYSIISQLPNFINSSGDSAGLSESTLNTFFTGSATNDVNKMTFANTAKIIEIITKDYPNLKITGQDFLNGEYTDEYNQTKSGVYKLYYEPYFSVRVNGVPTALTLRDMIAYDRENNKILANYYKGAMKLANSVFLVKDEKAINMTAYDGSAVTDKVFTSGSRLRTVAEKGKTFYNSMGIGVVTGGVYKPKNEPEVIKTYVTVESVDSDGTVHYKKAAETVKESAEFYLDSKGNLLQIPKIEEIEGAESGVAILNDIFTTKQDLTVDSKSEWTDSTLPTNVGVSLKATAEDIAGYNFGIVTNSEVFIDTYNTMSAHMGSAKASYEATKEYHKELLEKQASFASEQLRFYEFGAGLAQTANSAGTSIQPITLVDKTVTAVKYVSNDKVLLGQLDKTNSRVEKIAEEDKKDGIEYITTPANNLVLRFVIKKTPHQYNTVIIYDEKTSTSTYVDGGSFDLAMVNGVVTIQNPTVPSGLGTPELVEWVTNSELPIKDISDGVLPSKSNNGLSGLTNESIINYPEDPITHNLYVIWKVTVPDPEKIRDTVSQWRLSKYCSSLMGLSVDKTPHLAYMNLNLISDSTTHKTSTLNPNSGYSYNTINPNGQITSSTYNPDNMSMKTISTTPLKDYASTKANSWFHSKALAKSATSVTHNTPYSWVTMDGDLNMIKSTESSGLTVAKWLTNSATINGLQQHSISTGVLPTSNPNGSNYSKQEELKFGIYNKDIYKHQIAAYYHYTCHHKNYSHDVCRCYLIPQIINPSDASYKTTSFDVTVDFDRYIAKSSDKLVAAPNVTTENGKTTIAYQTNDTLKVYPEVAMLFDNDKGDSSIKWVIGEQAREINPVIYHTMQFKLFVDENSIISNYATDSRATTAARKLGEANKQVAYKGSPVNTTFSVKRSEDSTDKGILTVKTYALDLNTNKNGVNVKTAWGADSYNPLAIHNKFVSAWSGFKGTSTERLEIQSASLYTGANKTQSVSLNTKTYGGQSVTTFTHELIVRGGVVIGVRLQDKENKSYSVVSVETLKTKDANLYEALVGMKLVGSKQDTVLKGFEHQTGAQLTEDKFITLANQAKQNVDGLASNNLGIGKGWYSEDTTVLVVKEYITNYEVPSIAYSDKISLSVKGLESPINKNDFFSVLGKGHTYINYTFNSLDLSSINSGLKGSQKVFFEHSSRTGTLFGKINTDYLVGNVSVTDTTRIN